jgi:molybdopterin-guanine dinucleotide biosynthesis protein B
MSTPSGDESMPSPPVICIVGRSKSGRTTLIEKLIRELKRRGYRVGTVKHHSHPGFEVDQPGKDTWRHAQAGSDHVVIAAPDKVASIRRVEHESTLDAITATMTDVDVILTEGYLRSGRHRIEVVRAARSREPICGPEELLAWATDVPLPGGAPQFALDDAAGLVNLIEGLL